MYQLSILALSDVHSHISLYDYFLNQASMENGLILAGSKMRAIKKENEQKGILTLCLDNGDVLQGNIVADYAASNALKIHPMAEMMNQIPMDVSTFGNHEFNYGLNYLNDYIQSTTFPIVNCNVYDKNNEPLTQPYTILERTFHDGTPIKIGITGVVPEEILKWDKAHLEDKVIVKPMIEALQQTTQQLKTADCDLIIGLLHTGMNTSDLEKTTGENLVYQLAKNSDLDALVFGHTHQMFPSDDYKDLPNVDIEKGKIFNTFAVQPVSFGSHLGQIDFVLDFDKQSKKFSIQNGQSKVIHLKEAALQIDEDLVQLNQKTHEALLDYIAQPIGHTNVPIQSYFSQIAPSRAVEIVAKAGKHKFMEITKEIDLGSEGIISTSAPIKAGRDGIYDYVDIPAGPLTLKDAISIYRFPNTMAACNVTGKVLKEWLEWSVSCFNTLDQPLILKDNQSTEPGFPSYNQDIFYELSYTIDLSVPARYSNIGEKINNTNRINDVIFNGAPVNDEAIFTVLTNDYRLSFCPILQDNMTIIPIETLEVRQVVIDYIKSYGLDFEPSIPFKFKHNGPYPFITSSNAKEASNIRATNQMHGEYQVFEITNQ